MCESIGEANIRAAKVRSWTRGCFRVAAALIGPVLLGYLVIRAGPALVWRQAQSVGWGLALIVLLGGLPQMVRTWAWRQAFICDISGLSWSRSLGSQLASDAIGQLGIAGKLIGEGVRVSMLGSAVPLANGISACAIDGAMHAFTAVVITIAGITATFAITPISGRWRVYAFWVPVVLIAAVVLAAVAVANRWPLMGNAARAIGRVPRLSHWVSDKLEVIDSAEHNLLTFRHKAPIAFWASFGLNLLWHLLAILEVYLILRFMGIDLAIAGALALEGLTKVINLVGAVIPGNVGTYEGGNMMIARLFGITSTAGLTLALCRRVRAILWAAIGAICMFMMRKRPK